MAQDSLSKSLDAEHFLHHFTDKEMVTTQHIISLFFLIFLHSSSTILTLQTCFASAIESLFELCLRIRALIGFLSRALVFAHRFCRAVPIRPKWP
jgi:hypothetical protein